MPLFNLLAIDNFQAVRSVPPKDLSPAAVEAVKRLDEKEELEVWLQDILTDTNRTPHGPSEIVDILTHKLSVRGKEGIAAFILKGKSFPVVRPPHVSHQIFRLGRINGLTYAILAAPGTVLDEVKEHFLSMVHRIGCDYAMLDAHDLARIFAAFGFICPRDGKIIRGRQCDCGYLPGSRTSNILQEAALRELEEAHRYGEKAGAIILPTGSGKTRIAVVDAKRTNTNLCIYIAHSHEILESAEEEFLREFYPSDVRRFTDTISTRDLRRINLATIQSVSRNLELLKHLDLGYMVIDEFHHAAAPSYLRTIGALSPKFLLGLTATPFRSDSKDVLALCGGNEIVRYELRHGIEFGVLCPYNYYGCFDNIDYSTIRHNGVRYDVRDLERALIIPERHAGVVAKWKERARNKPTLAFCCSHVHAERVASAFLQEGVEAQVYLSSTDYETRASLREQLRVGAVKVLCVVDVFNEGVDLPFVECLLFLRPTESKRVFLQQFGRGLRRFFGRQTCIVIDFIGNFKNAYRVFENLGLEPTEDETLHLERIGYRGTKELLNLPIGCTVEFDERVLEIFGDQTLNPAFATRSNISKILIHQYRRLEVSLRRRPKKQDVDRNCILGSNFYVDVFGSWEAFERRVSTD